MIPKLTASERFVAKALRRELLPILPPLFSILVEEVHALGLGLFVHDEDNSCKEWGGEPLNEVVRVELWVESGNQYIWTERLQSTKNFTPANLGHPFLREGRAAIWKVETLEELATWFNPDNTTREDLHPALHPFVWPVTICSHCGSHLNVELSQKG